MKFTRTAWCCLLALILTLVVSSVVSANTSGPFTTTTPKASTKTDWTAGLAFPKFNSALGTLLSVELKITAAYDTVLTITNNASSASNGWAKTELVVNVEDAGSNLVYPVLDMLTPQYNFSLAPGQFVTTGNIHKSGSSDNIYTSAAVLAAFNGPGTITLNADTMTFAVISYTGGNTDAVQSTYASATGTVTYEYAVPEPSGLLVLGPAFLGMLGMIRRRR
jgi:hypothetical protein